MVVRLCLTLLAGCAAAAAAPLQKAAAALEARDIDAAAGERAGLRPADIAWLDHPKHPWQHLQTEHFVVHHDQKMFAAKVARMGEQFYAAIAADLPDLRDRCSPRRSHVFVFRDPRDWQAVVEGTPGLERWASSFVRGQVMYLQETGATAAEKMETLAHEMAHLVFNRFLAVPLPLWLNEGLAEYYGEFAYRAARGMGQSRRAAFPPLKTWYPLSELLTATAYPAAPAEVARFYATSKYLVGFLLLRQPKEKWNSFFERILSGEPPWPALLETYGWPDNAALEKDFARFAR